MIGLSEKNDTGMTVRWTTKPKREERERRNGHNGGGGGGGGGNDGAPSTSTIE
jgi:hypothetical protein